jgi:ketosteroid isomerase-like protein
MEAAGIALVREAFEAFARRDLARLVDLTDPQIEFFAPTAALANEGRCYRGHEGLARYLNDVERVWAHLDVTPEKFRAVGNHIVAIGTVRAQARDGLEVDNPVVWVWEVCGGRICRGCVYDDPGETSNRAPRDSETAMPALGPLAGDTPPPARAV